MFEQGGFRRQQHTSGYRRADEQRVDQRVGMVRQDEQWPLAWHAFPTLHGDVGVVPTQCDGGSASQQLVEHDASGEWRALGHAAE